MIAPIDADAGDYVMTGDSAWVQVDGVAVWIRRLPDGTVRVELHTGDATGAPVDGAEAHPDDR